MREERGGGGSQKHPAAAPFPLFVGHTLIHCMGLRLFPRISPQERNDQPDERDDPEGTEGLAPPSAGAANGAASGRRHGTRELGRPPGVFGDRHANPSESQSSSAWLNVWAPRSDRAKSDPKPLIVG